MALSREDWLKRIGYYTQDRDTILLAVFGSAEAKTKARATMTGAAWDELQDGIMGVFFHIRSVARDYGFESGRNGVLQNAATLVRGEVIRDIIADLTRDE